MDRFETEYEAAVDAELARSAEVRLADPEDTERTPWGELKAQSGL